MTGRAAGLLLSISLLLLHLFPPLAAAQPAPAASTPAPAEATQLDQARIANEQAQAAYYRKQVEQPAKLDPLPWINAALPFLGVFVGGFLSYWATEHLSRKALRSLCQRQKVQVRAAVDDLRRTLHNLHLEKGHVPSFVNEDYLVQKFARPVTYSRDDPFYQKYDLVDLIYRLCALLGWMELYRSDPTFLSGSKNEKAAIEECFTRIRGAFSSSSTHFTFAPESATPAETTGPFNDGFILEDEQRAIGEMMLTIATKDTTPTVLGYAAFCTLFDYGQREPDQTISRGGQNYWVWNATQFVVGMAQPGPHPPRDLRRVRLLKVLGALEDLYIVLS